MSTAATPARPAGGAIEEVEVHGHIIDSLLLPKILDRILQMGGTFEIRECRIGSRRIDPSQGTEGAILIAHRVLGGLGKIVPVPLPAWRPYAGLQP